MLTIEQMIATVRPIADKYSVETVQLFGSYANGTPQEQSDVDLLVKFKAHVPSIFAVMGFREEMQMGLKTPVDVVTLPLVRPEKMFIDRTVSLYEA